MPVTPHKIQGFKSQFKFVPPAGGSAVQCKSLAQFDLDIKGETLDASDHDSVGWKEKMTGMLDWSGSLKAVYVEGDATQADLLTAITTQAKCSGTFYPEVAAGQQSYVGDFVVTGYKHGGTANNGVQTLDITVEGAGPLTPTVQV